MTPQQFQQTFQPQADLAATGTGLQSGLFLAQWAVETAYASVFAGAFNLGNITRGGASNGFVNYGSYDQFVNAQILLLHDPIYASVLASAGKTLAEQCQALGASPWDAGHYNNGSGPGSSLIAILPTFGFDPNSRQSLGEDDDMARLVAVDITAGSGAAQYLVFDYQGHAFKRAVTSSQESNALQAAGYALEQHDATGLPDWVAPSPSGVDLSPVLTAIAAVKADVDAIKARTDKDLA